MIIFILGVIFGFLLCTIFILISYMLIRQLIFKHGNSIINTIEKEITTLKDKTIDTNSIIFPDIEKEIFLQEESSLEDLIKQ